MNEILQELVELTRLDRELTLIQEQLAHYPAMTARMDVEEERQRKLIEAAEADLEKARHQRRHAEKEILTLQEQTRKLSLQQASVKTNKEYQAMLHEIESVRAKIDDLETEGLEKIEAEDNAAARRKESAGRLATLKAAHDEERRRIQTQITEKKDKQQRLAGERQRRLGTLPEELQDNYEALNKKFPGTACVPVEGDNCGGCHWALVPNTRQLVRKPDELAHCDHCRRYLYAAESVK